MNRPCCLFSGGLTTHKIKQTVVLLQTIVGVCTSAIKLQQVAQLSQTDRAAGWVSYGQKWKSGTGRQYLRTI